MNRFGLIGLALTVSLLAASAAAEEISWHPANPLAPNAPPVTLKTPTAAGPVSLQQTSYSDAPGFNGVVTRAKQDEKPLPVGPSLTPEAGPAPKVLQHAPPQSPAAEESWGTPVSKYVGGAHEGSLPGEPLPGCCDGDTCGAPGCCAAGCCADTSWWSTLWSRCCLGDLCSCCRRCLDCCRESCCGDPFCDDGCCPRRPLVWGKAEYLLWTVKSSTLPPLVTANGTPGAPPVIGVGNTKVIFGGRSQDFDMRSGGRFTIGFDLPCLDMGLETTYFFLADRTNRNTFASSGVPGLGRPFREVGGTVFIAPGVPSPGNQQAQLVALAGKVSGSVSVDGSNELWGVEANFRNTLCCGSNYHVDLLWGFRHLNLMDNVDITENLTGIGGTAIRGGATSIAVSDRFLTRNEFYGGQLGVDGEFRLGRWSFGGTGKLALGTMHQTVSIDGNTLFRDGPAPGLERGGLLALPGTNIGRYNRDSFALVPEVGLRLGFYFTEHWRAYVGYDVLYASNVVRPGDQIDINVNSTFLPRNGPPVGAPLPAFNFHTSDFWAQGVCFGMELRY